MRGSRPPFPPHRARASRGLALVPPPAAQGPASPGSLARRRWRRRRRRWRFGGWRSSGGRPAPSRSAGGFDRRLAHGPLRQPEGLGRRQGGWPPLAARRRDLPGREERKRPGHRPGVRAGAERAGLGWVRTRPTSWSAAAGSRSSRPGHFRALEGALPAGGHMNRPALACQAQWSSAESDEEEGGERGAPPPRPRIRLFIFEFCPRREREPEEGGVEREGGGQGGRGRGEGAWGATGNRRSRS